MSETTQPPVQPRGEPTTSFDATGAFRPAREVPSETNPAADSTQELPALLRWRLALLSLICLCTVAPFAVILTPFYIRDGSWRYLVVVWFGTALATTGTFVLRSRRLLSLRSLRIIELVAFGLVVGYLTFEMYHSLFHRRFGAIYARLGESEIPMQLKPVPFLKQEPYWTLTLKSWTMWALSGWQVLAWILFLFGYSLFIPNTWRRAAVILSVVAAIPVVLHGTICLFDPEVK